MGTEADHLCILFRVGGFGFVMPAAEMMAVRDMDGLVMEVDGSCIASCQVGVLGFQDVEVPVFDLTSFLRLSAVAPGEESRCLVFTGSEGPWAFIVDRVDGVFDRALFDYRELPDYLLEGRDAPYRSVAIRNGEPLVNFDPEELGRQLVGADYATGPV